MLENRTMPSCTVIPELVYEDVGEAIDWLCATFRSSERWREFSSAVLVRVDDADSHHSRARESGARILHEPTDHPYGERQCSAMDLAGHRWCFTQSIADLAPEQWGGTSAEL
jgi:uncharacterized glyoxalase superfamily protein PhnB